MPLHVPIPAVALEGDYSTWTEIWEYDFPDGLDAVFEVSITFSPQYLYITYLDASSYYRFAIIQLSDGSSKFTSPSEEDYTADHPYIGYTQIFQYNTLVEVGVGAASFSIMSKYVCIGINGQAQFEIWKDGVKVWTSPLASEAVSGAANYDSVGISYDGKYAIALTDNKKLVCFEGS